MVVKNLVVGDFHSIQSFLEGNDQFGVVFIDLMMPWARQRIQKAEAAGEDYIAVVAADNIITADLGEQPAASRTIIRSAEALRIILNCRKEL